MPIPHQLSRGGATLSNIGNLNIIVGRNGSGKSRFLRMLSQLRDQAGFFVRYVSPERAGSFEPDAGIENTARNNKNWIEDQRGRNQASNFKQASASRLKELAMRFAVRVESDASLRSDLTKTFITEQLAKINSMLSNVIIDREGAQEFYFMTIDGVRIRAEDLSSGESEVLSLATEILHFFDVCQPDKINVLLLDEPDVHLHPDLQSRLARFLIRELTGVPPQLQERVVVCVATHSTPLICELALHLGCTIGTKDFASDAVVQRTVADQLKKLAPFFGHPLSKSISDDVPLILEGEDDERVWQQAARTAQGRLRVFPTLATSVQHQAELESFCASLLSAIYDHASAISIRDGDGIRGTLNSIGCVSRFRLQCYAIENLLLTDDVLTALNSDWPTLVQRINEWCASNSTHKDVAVLSALAASQDRFRDTKIKEIRQLIPAILGSSKPWEVHVGQTLGRINAATPRGANSIVDYVGVDALRAVALL